MTDPRTDPDDEAVDRRLRQYATRWRGTLPSSPAAGPYAERRRASLLVPAAAVAAVAMVLATVWAVGDRSNRGAIPREPITTDGVVPWAALPTTDPVFPTIGGGPSAAEIKTAAPCEAGDLTVLRRDLEPALGTAFLTVQLALDGPTPCRIEGYPDVFLLDPSGAVLDVSVVHDPGSTPEPVLVTPTEPAAVVVSWSPSHYCGALDNPRIRIGLPDNAGNVTVDGFGPTTCNPDEGHPSPRVRPVQPAYADTSPTSPYEQVTVTGDLDLSVDVGAPIDFEITLTSPVDLPLDPCPDYEILLAPRIDYHGLNCAAVPYVDEEGRPYLPAGVPVTFAMHASGFDTTVLITKFAWVLTAPGHPTAGGTVTIGDAAPPEATVTGFVTMDGGPAPGTSIKITEGTVHARGIVDRTAPIVSGQFEMHLPAGRYDLWATSPEYGDGQAECQPTDLPDGLALLSGQVVQVAISCQMR
jgi:hypothetical protein